MGKYEKELRELLNEKKHIPSRLAEIKGRGLKVRSCQKSVRKAKAVFEISRRECLTLPKLWTDYAPHGKNKDMYARPEVQKIRNAFKKMEWEEDMLTRYTERYNNRLPERRELKARLRLLPELIESAKMLIEIELKRKASKKPTQPKDWAANWHEVAPGLVVPAKILRAYIKTFPKTITFNDESVTVSDNVFMFKPFANRNTFLKLPCVTWDDARRTA